LRRTSSSNVDRLAGGLSRDGHRLRADARRCADHHAARSRIGLQLGDKLWLRDRQGLRSRSTALLRDVCDLVREQQPTLLRLRRVLARREIDVVAHRHRARIDPRRDRTCRCTPCNVQLLDALVEEVARSRR
jgi:hypothetical protein